MSGQNPLPARWPDFTSRLAATLAVIPEQSFLILDVEPRHGIGDEAIEGGYFVQFSQRGQHGFRVEAAANAGLPEDLKLPKGSEATLAKLGWLPPDPHPDDPRSTPSHYREWPQPPPYAEIAQMAVSTLRRAFRVRSPRQLRYKSFDEHGRESLQPLLGISRGLESRTLGSEPTPASGSIEDVREFVDIALSEFIGTEAVEHDEGGDIPLQLGSAMAFVSVLDGEPPVVRVFSPILWGLQRTDGLLEALNEINLRIRLGRAFWTGEEVVAAIDLPSTGLTIFALQHACFEIGSLADHFDDELRERFGGRAWFDEEPSPRLSLPASDDTAGYL